MIAVAGYHTVFARRQCRLQPHRNRLLADVEMAKAADQTQPVKLPSALFKAADQQHLLVEMEQLFVGSGKPLGKIVRLLEAAQRKSIIGGSGSSCSRFGQLTSPMASVTGRIKPRL